MRVELAASPEDFFTEFVSQCKDRLDDGAYLYGNTSFSKNPLVLINEVQEEVKDICNWAFILFVRLEKIRESVYSSGLDDTTVVETYRDDVEDLFSETDPR